MLNFNNTHLFTNYLKQKLSSVNIPVYKIYTREFTDYAKAHGSEDPRVLESFKIKDSDGKFKHAQINYLKNTKLCQYYYDETLGTTWRTLSDTFYDPSRNTPGLTKTLNSPGNVYDSNTHEFLGDYLRFLRDYYNINLMSLYNCFTNTICNNIDRTIEFEQSSNTKSTFNSFDAHYNIYVLPVKLFQDYTIAIDCEQGVELACGFYDGTLEDSTKANQLLKKTY